MTIRKMENSLPPSPPTSSEGEFSSLDIRSTYPPTYGLIDSGLDQFHMAGDFNPGTPPPKMLYGSPPQLEYYPAVPTSNPVPIMPGPQVTTPQMMPTDIPGRVQSSSPSFAPPSSRKNSTKSKAKATRSPRERRGRNHRNGASGSRSKIIMPGPLSVITAHFQNTPIRDIEAYVTRPTPVRLEEARVRQLSERKAVARPMNSFMLYRSAYTARCKEFLGMENHQEISRAIGASWELESEQIKAQFNEWSRLERTNHASAFPGYKFQPKKESTVTRRSETIELTPPRSSVSAAGDMDSPTEWDELADPDFSLVPHPLHHRANSFGYSSRGSSPLDGYHCPPPTLTSSYDTAWNTSFPSQSLPTNLSTIQPSMLQGPAFDDDAKFEMHSAQSFPNDMPSGINGIPGGSHEDLCQASQPLPHVGHMDPQLLQYSQDAQPVHDHAVLSSSHQYPMGFEDTYISTMPSGHSSPAVYHGLDLGEATWDYIDQPASSSF